MACFSVAFFFSSERITPDLSIDFEFSDFPAPLITKLSPTPPALGSTIEVCDSKDFLACFSCPACPAVSLCSATGAGRVWMSEECFVLVSRS